MERFSIYVKEMKEGHTQHLYDNLHKQMNTSRQSHSAVAVFCSQAEDHMMIHCEAKTDETDWRDERYKVIRNMANSLAAYVVDDCEHGRIIQMIQKRLKVSTDEETAKIWRYCLQVMSEDDSCGHNQKEQHRKKVSAAIQQYLAKHSRLNLEGFIRFRLKDYIDDLNEIVDYAVEEYMMDKQYQEFITLLKCFVYAQETKIPSVHLIHKGNYEFKLFDEQMQPLETESIEGLIVEKIDSDMNYEDMIVSTLITVCPEKIYIHTRERDLQVIKTICQIFENRTVVCEGCHRCRAHYSAIFEQEGQR